jgi:hypothetical protein
MINLKNRGRIWIMLDAISRTKLECEAAQYSTDLTMDELIKVHQDLDAATRKLEALL